MDDKPAIEYHPFGQITLNFDDGPIKLRRCRLGDLEFGKNLLKEIDDESAEKRTALAEEGTNLGPLVSDLTDLDNAGEERQEQVLATLRRFGELRDLLDGVRIDIVYLWLSQVAERMGDGNTPPKDEWPLDLLTADLPGEVISHWQSRPLASGKTLGQNRTTVEANNSGPHLQEVSSHPVPPPQ